ncbi:C-3 sterol dehydrogenase [Suillus occidentalis]|nr:C-3 sterol dehydrogenase [Suillus occidentalis]
MLVVHIQLYVRLHDVVVARGNIFCVFDVDFYSGDITDESQLLDVLNKVRATLLIFMVTERQLTLLLSAVRLSAVGMTADQYDLYNPHGFTSESPPHSAKDPSIYHKVILEAKRGLLNVALRPAGIFGEGDRQMMVGLYQAYQHGQTHFQVGDNNSLFDYTYVGNLIKAHLIAADKLSSPSLHASSQETLTTDSLKTELHLDHALQPVSTAIRVKRVLTCEARPLGPSITLPRDPHTPAHHIIRSRFDQSSENAIDLAESSLLQVAGQVFFITNGEPVYFWDFMRFIWLALDPPSSKLASGSSERAQRSAWPRGFGMVLECWAPLIGKEAGFTRYRVGYSCATRYHNIEKARHALGYEPEVGLEDGGR